MEVLVTGRVWLRSLLPGRSAVLRLDPQGAAPRRNAPFKRQAAVPGHCFQNVVRKVKAPPYFKKEESERSGPGSGLASRGREPGLPLGKKVKWVWMAPACQVPDFMAVGKAATVFELEIRKWDHLSWVFLILIFVFI